MLKIEYVKTADLIPYANNPRKNDAAVDKVVESIREFGFKNPIIVDSNNEIIAGHTRLKAAEKLGMEEVPTIKAEDLTPEQVKAFRIADNKTHEFAEWDMDLLREELDGINLFTGFDEDELREILDNVKFSEVEEDDFDPTPPEEPKSKLGDIYQLGRHRLMCGDATKKEDVERLMDGKKADLMFTDPPYELDTKGGGILKSANSMKQISENGVDVFDPSVLEMHCKTNIFFHNKPLIKKYIELAEKNGMPFDLCFYKKLNTAPNYGGHMMTDCEYIAIIGAQAPNKGLPKETYSKCYIGKKDSGNELSYSKPVELCAKYIQLYSNETVLDLFGGSGSTLIACEQLNRTCYMMELDPRYCDVIINRWEQLTGQKAVRLNG
jgi:DNA modification methylase